MRPSAAIRTTVSAASAVSGSSGRPGQTLCASSITISIGTRRARAAPQPPEHRRGRERLLLARRERAEVHDQAARPVLLQRVEHRPGLAARPDPVLVQPEVADPRAEPPRLGPVARQQRLQRRRPLLREHRGQLGVLVAVGDRVEPQQRGLGVGPELAQREPQPLVGAGSRRVDLDAAGDLAIALGQRRIGARRARRRGGRSPSSDRGSRAAARCRPAAARGSARASRSCPSPTARTGTCGGRSRRRRARAGRPAPA